MTAPSLFYALHVLNPYRGLLDQVGMCPDRPQVQQRLVRLVFLWTETAESLRRAEQALAVVGRDYGREINSHRRALARLHQDDPAQREHERAISLLERGGYETLTWRLMVAARDVEKRRVALEDIERQLEGYSVGVPAAAD